MVLLCRLIPLPQFGQYPISGQYPEIGATPRQRNDKCPPLLRALRRGVGNKMKFDDPVIAERLDLS